MLFSGDGWHEGVPTIFFGPRYQAHELCCLLFGTSHRFQQGSVLLLPPALNPDTQRWAAFCAAMVEWLCWQEGVPCPSWAAKERYILPEPWFYYGKWSRRAKLLATTPAPFKMRNIFIGDRAFVHKGLPPL